MNYYREPICLYGWGTLIEQVYYQLVEMIGREPDFISDVSPEKWGKYLYNTECISPYSLSKIENPKIIVTVRNFESAARTLKSVGIHSWDLIVYERSNYRIGKILSKEHFHSAVQIQVADLMGRKALVTGASRGLGRVIALFLAKYGCDLIIHATSNDQLKSLKRECELLGVKIETVACDFANSDSFDQFLERAKTFDIDFCINNAAYSPPIKVGNWCDISIEHYQLCFKINAIAPIKIMGCVIPRMIERCYGKVINISSGIQYRPESGAYAISKAALDKFVDDLVPSLRGSGVSTICVDPGSLSTDMSGNLGLPPDSALPGCVLPCFIEGELRHSWLNAQDFSGLDIQSALEKHNLMSERS